MFGFYFRQNDWVTDNALGSRAKGLELWLRELGINQLTPRDFFQGVLIGGSGAIIGGNQPTLTVRNSAPVRQLTGSRTLAR